jgi:hypothetical protein
MYPIVRESGFSGLLVLLQIDSVRQFSLRSSLFANPLRSLRLKAFLTAESAKKSRKVRKEV